MIFQEGYLLKMSCWPKLTQLGRVPYAFKTLENCSKYLTLPLSYVSSVIFSLLYFHLYTRVEKFGVGKGFLMFLKVPHDGCIHLIQ